MKSYRYIKVSPVTITVPVIPFFSIMIGITILVWVIAPILSFSYFYISGSSIITPLSDDARVFAAEKTPIDFSKASTWFPKNPSQKTATTVEQYELSIPSLRIDHALVKIGTDDLSKNLIHYGGTGLPGREGNSVIFGHSVLPSFYDPKNYLTIFSLLPQLKNGDELFIHFDGIDYRYQVVETKVTEPEDVSGLEQTFDDSYLTLVTCVPPGTYWKRLWVKFRASPFGETKKHELSRN